MSKTITKIGKDQCKLLRKEVTAALEKTLAEFGLKAELGNMTYNGQTVSTKLTIAVAEYDKQTEEFNNHCWKFGLTADNFGDLFESNGKQYQLVGIKPRSHKYPFIGERVSDRKKFKFSKHILGQVLAA